MKERKKERKKESKQVRKKYLLSQIIPIVSMSSIKLQTKNNSFIRYILSEILSPKPQ